MSKYNNLWIYIADSGEDELKLTYEAIEKISGAKVDHSFLTYKKELSEYGYEVGKISMTAQTIEFRRH